MFACWVIPLVLSTNPQEPASDEPTAKTLLIHADRVIARPGVELENASILIDDGVIVAVGEGLSAPEGAREIHGGVVCSGFINPWSSLGLDAGSATDMNTNPATRSVDGIDDWVDVEERREALRGGVTMARTQTGIRASFGGLGAVIRCDPDSGPGRAVASEDACLQASIGVTRGGRRADVFARVGEVDKLAGKIESGRRYLESKVEYRHDLEEWQKTIDESTAKLEKDFKKAKKDRDKKKKEAEEKDKEFKEEKYKEDKKPSAPKSDPEAEALSRVADGEIPLVVEVHRAEEIRRLLDKTSEFDRLRLVIAGGTESVVHAAELARRRIPVIVWPSPGGARGKDEYDMHRLSIAGELSRAGVKVLIGTGGERSSRDLRLLAALAVGHGLDPAEALSAITEYPAEVFDLASVGAVERGKDAELVVLDGDPLDSTTRVRYVISHGQVVIEQ